jgi:hypothetical protein
MSVFGFFQYEIQTKKEKNYNILKSGPLVQSIESLSMTTKYEDVLDKFCPSAHYLAHTEFEVTGGGCSTCLPLYILVSRL